MKTHMPDHIATAPRLRLRRVVKVYFFPWAQVVFVFCLALYGWRIGVPLFTLIAFGSIVFTVCLFEDLAAPQSRIMYLRSLVEKLFNHRHDADSPPEETVAETQVYSTYRPSSLFPHHLVVRWYSPLAILIATWLYACVQATLFPVEGLGVQLTFTLSLFFFGIFPFAMLVASTTRRPFNARKRYSLYLLATLGMVLALWSFSRFTSDARIILFILFINFFLYTTLYIIQRLWVGYRARNEVIRKISLTFLDWIETGQKQQHVPESIGSQLKYDRVFILEATPDQQKLQIIAEYGDYRAPPEKTVPVDRSLTGQAFTKKTPIVWNDVAACPYYYSIDPDEDDTRAEIAVPIAHHEAIYGILDVQSRVKGAYGTGDVAALETMGRILGAAIALEKREQFFTQAVQLWEDVMATQASLVSERDVFDLFAGFARERLDADLVIYFPLSLAGYPVRYPFISGHLRKPQLIHPPIRDANSSLIKFVANWQPYFETNISETSPVVRFTTPGTPGFVEREGIKSTCFLPVGMHQERLGALFLNFRQHKIFDDTFKFTVFSLAHSLAQVTAQVRYREVSFKSFGRPEMNWHSIVGRRGFKKGVMGQARQLHTRCRADCRDDLSECEMYSLFRDVDDFIEEIRLVESSRPPDFWEEMLEEQLKRYKSVLPDSAENRRPLLDLNIDGRIEKEYPLIKLALYRVITEAANNAIIHGDASCIDVNVRRQTHTIEASIVNNGLPLPDKAVAQKSDNGIYAMLEECEAKLGADTHIGNHKDGKGVIVHVSIPALPLTERRRTSL